MNLIEKYSKGWCKDRFSIDKIDENSIEFFDLRDSLVVNYTIRECSSPLSKESFNVDIFPGEKIQREYSHYKRDWLLHFSNFSTYLVEKKIPFYVSYEELK